MKLTLVHPPFATLTAVPAGICLLKSYIKTHYPTHEVLTMDLNLEMFEWLHDLDFEERRTVVREMGDIEPLTCQEVEIQRKILRAGTHKNFSSENEINSVLSAQDNFLLKLSDALQTTVIYLLLQDKSPGEFRLFEFVVKRILSTQPDIVGISVFSNFQLAAALGLTAILRQKYNIPVMMGGPAMLDFDLNELMNVFSFNWIFNRQQSLLTEKAPVIVNLFLPGTAASLTGC